MTHVPAATKLTVVPEIEQPAPLVVRTTGMPDGPPVATTVYWPPTGAGFGGVDWKVIFCVANWAKLTVQIVSRVRLWLKLWLVVPGSSSTVTEVMWPRSMPSPRPTLPPPLSPKLMMALLPAERPVVAMSSSPFESTAVTLTPATWPFGLLVEAVGKTSSNTSAEPPLVRSTGVANV